MELVHLHQCSACYFYIFQWNLSICTNVLLVIFIYFNGTCPSAPMFCLLFLYISMEFVHLHQCSACYFYIFQWNFSICTNVLPIMCLYISMVNTNEFSWGEMWQDSLPNQQHLIWSCSWQLLGYHAICRPQAADDKISF